MTHEFSPRSAKVSKRWQAAIDGVAVGVAIDVAADHGAVWGFAVWTAGFVVSILVAAGVQVWVDERDQTVKR